MKNIFSVFRLLRDIKYKYLFYRSIVIVAPDSSLIIGKGTKIMRCKIVVKNNHHVVIGDNCTIKDSSLAFYSADGLSQSSIGSNSDFHGVQLQCYGSFKCGDYNTFVQPQGAPAMLTSFNGSLETGHHCRFHNRFWIRFGAKVRIGNYNNINAGSWLRADESITIGDYNQISYNVMIWDTNTHNIYPKEKRRKLAEQYYPFFGYEYEKPQTKPVHIGNDCWIAQNVALMKGTRLCDEVVVGYGTFLFGAKIDAPCVVTNKIEIRTH